MNAGHPPAILQSTGKQSIKVVEQDGDIIGAFDDAGFGRIELQVGKGDRLFLFSDGLIERDGSRTSGMARLLDACATHAARPLDEAVAGISALVLGDGPAEDDVVLMGIEA